ncbi:reverse transcriptase domain-containing protein [Tanacetum coccineum]
MRYSLPRNIQRRIITRKLSAKLARAELDKGSGEANMSKDMSAFVKENIDALRTIIKEHDRQNKTKTTPRKLVYAESKREASDELMARSFSNRLSLESSRGWRTGAKLRKGPEGRNPKPEEEGPNIKKQVRTLSMERRIEDYLTHTYKRLIQLISPPRITRFKYHRRAKLPRNIRVYEGNKDSEDHLKIFLAAAEQEEWPMPIWCKMFCQTLGGATRNWFDDLDPKSVDSFEELSQKLLEEFSQQNRYAKDPTEIHDIKRRQNKGLQTFMDQFNSERLAKKLNDKIPKTVDEMFERVRAFIRGEMAAGSAEMVHPP